MIRLRGDRSQRFVARKAGVPTGTYCQWELGKRLPREAQFPKILQGLGCTRDELAIEVWKIQAEQFLLQGLELPLLANAQPASRSLKLKLDADWRKDLEKNLSPELVAAFERLLAHINRLGGDLELSFATLEQILADFAAIVTGIKRNKNR